MKYHIVINTPLITHGTPTYYATLRAYATSLLRHAFFATLLRHYVFAHYATATLLTPPSIILCHMLYAMHYYAIATIWYHCHDIYAAATIDLPPIRLPLRH